MTRKLKDLAVTWRFWLTTGTLVIVTLGALGMTIDRPAWISEVRAIESIMNQNSHAIIQIRLDAVQRRIWAQEDRLEVRPTGDGVRRLRELKIQYRRLEERKKNPKLKK